jgi:hypothetical protein
LLPGNTPCYSLTKTEKITSTTREGGATFMDIAIVPLPSTYAEEGYLHREEVEGIFKSAISTLKTTL